jgi:hypothetical protein
MQRRIVGERNIRCFGKAIPSEFYIRYFSREFLPYRSPCSNLIYDPPRTIKIPISELSIYVISPFYCSHFVSSIVEAYTFNVHVCAFNTSIIVFSYPHTMHTVSSTPRNRYRNPYFIPWGRSHEDVSGWSPQEGRPGCGCK